MGRAGADTYKCSNPYGIFSNPTCSQSGPCTNGHTGVRSDCQWAEGVQQVNETYLTCEFPYCYSQLTEGMHSKSKCECVKNTGGTCRFLGCWTWRGNAVCNTETSLCECQPGHCSVCGTCKPKDDVSWLEAQPSKLGVAIPTVKTM